MDNLHYIQMLALKQLAFRESAAFAELNTTKLSNDHFSYHLRTLVQTGYVAKSGSAYRLTTKGKKYASHIDTSKNVIEKLPKVSVLVIAHQGKGKDREFLVQTRTKQPYYGYSGFPTGKLRYGETVSEGALRELLEETGVLAANHRQCFVLHEMVYDREGRQLEDKFFNVVEATGISGEVRSTPEGTNNWLTEQEFRSMDKLFHNEMDVLDWFLAGFEGFKEEKYVIDEF